MEINETEQRTLELNLSTKCNSAFFQAFKPLISKWRHVQCRLYYCSCFFFFICKFNHDCFWLLSIDHRQFCLCNSNYDYIRKTNRPQLRKSTVHLEISSILMTRMLSFSNELDQKLFAFTTWCSLILLLNI